jgi:hypothetical protein
MKRKRIKNPPKKYLETFSPEGGASEKVEKPAATLIYV